MASFIALVHHYIELLTHKIQGAPPKKARTWLVCFTSSYIMLYVNKNCMAY